MGWKVPLRAILQKQNKIYCTLTHTDIQQPLKRGRIMTNNKVLTDQQHYDWLTDKLRSLKRRTKIFKLLKEELGALGYWKNKKRGDGGRRFD